MPNYDKHHKKVMELCKEFPNSSSRSLARILSKETGLTMGNCQNRILRERNLVTKNKKENKITWQPQVEPSLAEPVETFVIKEKDVVIGSDAHYPYHDQQAVQIFVNYLRDTKPDAVLLNGDWLDMYKISRYTFDPSKINIREEFEMLERFLKMLRKLLPHSAIYYKKGNHEERFDHYIMSKAPEVWGLPLTRLEEVLHLDKYGVQIIGGRQFMKAGGLNIIHGHEIGKGIFSPVNFARTLYLKTKVNVVAGHTHTTSEHVEKDMDTKVVTCWSLGCLCDMKPDYATINKWNHGFGHLKVVTKNNWHFSNKKIIDGKIV